MGVRWGGSCLRKLWTVSKWGRPGKAGEGREIMTDGPARVQPGLCSIKRVCWLSSSLHSHWRERWDRPNHVGPITFRTTQPFCFVFLYLLISRNEICYQCFTSDRYVHDGCIDRDVHDGCMTCKKIEHGSHWDGPIFCIFGNERKAWYSNLHIST